MKNSVFFSALLGLALVVGVSGCKHGQVGTTHIPGANAKTPDTAVLPPVNPVGPTAPVIIAPPIPTPDTTVVSTNTPTIAMTENPKFEDVFKNGTEDRDIFKDDIVYFDTDSNVIKKSEQPKLERIAKYLKDNSADVVLVEGHCDERGTEGYNQSLGERRALAIREYLINMGIDGARIHTVSFGLSKPVDAGHNEAAWKKNRRGVSVLYRAKAKA